MNSFTILVDEITTHRARFYYFIINFHLQLIYFYIIVLIYLFFPVRIVKKSIEAKRKVC